jgi:predicted alpha/beta-fold hydrolase
VNSHYVQGIVERAGQRDWSVSVMVFRGCGPELNVAPRMYHSGETGDLRLLIQELTRRFPGEALVLLGVSLGGNVLLKYLGESPQSVPAGVRAAAAISVPYDLEAGSRHLQRGFARVYDRHFLRSLRRKALQKLEQHPGLFDIGRLMRATTIEQFDDAVTGPVHGFAGSHDYYSRSSSIHFIGQIEVPTLLLSARDDPFLPSDVLGLVREIASRNSRLTVRFTERGGHVGFLAGAIPFRPQYWAEEQVMTFLEAHAGEPASKTAVS